MSFPIVGLPYYEHSNVADHIRLGTTLYLAHDAGNKFSKEDTAVSAYFYDISMDQYRMIGHVKSEFSGSVLKTIQKSSKRIYTKGIGYVSVQAITVTVDECRPSSIRVTLDSEKSNTEMLIKPKLTEDKTMFDKIVATNKTVAVSAAYMEAGRIANNQVAKLVAAKAPLMVRGYVDTPIGKLVLANLVGMALEQFRPADKQMAKVANHMMANAYQELIRTVDIEGMLNELTSSEGIKNALAAVAGQETQS